MSKVIEHSFCYFLPVIFNYNIFLTCLQGCVQREKIFTWFHVSSASYSAFIEVVFNWVILSTAVDFLTSYLHMKPHVLLPFLMAWFYGHEGPITGQGATAVGHDFPSGFCRTKVEKEVVFSFSINLSSPKLTWPSCPVVDLRPVVSVPCTDTCLFLMLQWCSPDSSDECALWPWPCPGHVDTSLWLWLQFCKTTLNWPLLNLSLRDLFFWNL